MHRNNPVQALTKSEVGKYLEGDYQLESGRWVCSSDYNFYFRRHFGAKEWCRPYSWMESLRPLPGVSMSIRRSAPPFRRSLCHRFCSLGFVQQCRTLSIKEGAASMAFLLPRSIRAGTYPLFAIFISIGRESKMCMLVTLFFSPKYRRTDLVDYCGFVSMTNISP